MFVFAIEKELKSFKMQILPLFHKNSLFMLPLAALILSTMTYNPLLTTTGIPAYTTFTTTSTSSTTVITTTATSASTSKL